jgi:Zn-dependent protease
VLGFPLYLRWSVLLLMGLVTLLSGDLIGYGVGFGFVVCLLLSVLLHELGHALTARWLGIGVRGITLEILGGYTEMDRDAPTPRAELLVSLAGPAVSLVLGLSAAVAALVLPAGGPRQIAFLVALANIIVAVFNVLPGLPLDGGRALRATVWWVSGSRQRGTAVAARGGQAVGVATGLVAVWLYLAGFISEFGLILTILVAFSLWQGATVSARMARVSSRLTLVDVDRLARPIFAVPTGTPLAEAQRRAVESAPPEAALAVADSTGRLVALVHAGAAEAVPAARRPWVTVDSVARELATIRAVPAGLRGADALTFLQSDPAGEYLVTTDGRVVGVLRAADVARVLHAKSRGTGRPGTRRTGAGGPGAGGPGAGGPGAGGPGTGGPGVGR